MSEGTESLYEEVTRSDGVKFYPADFHDGALLALDNMVYESVGRKGRRWWRRVWLNPIVAQPDEDRDHPVMKLPLAAAERKAIPLARGLLDYFPKALAEVARLSAAATAQHHPDKEMHWDRAKSPDHADCIMRHLLDRGTEDADGFLHDVKVAWRALALAEIALEKAGK
jgi:hypothetical protein